MRGKTNRHCSEILNKGEEETQQAVQTSPWIRIYTHKDMHVQYISILMIMIVITMMMGMLTMTCSECGDCVDDYNQVNDNDPYCDDDMCRC